MDLMLFADNTRAVVLPLFQAVRDAFNTVFTWLNLVLNGFRAGTQLNPLLVPFLIIVGISFIYFVIKLIRSIVWGA